MLLANDLVINEDSCNLSCEYCLTGQSNFKSQHSDQLIFQPPRPDNCGPGTDLGERLRTVADRVRVAHDVPVLKLTGGELFLVRGIADLIVEMAALHEFVIVQTNAVLVKPEYLERFAEAGNIMLQVSIDAHTYEGNSYRVASPAIHERVLRKVEMCLRSPLFTEIYTVLNDRSVEHLPSFAEYLGQFGGVRMYPFPVRGPDSEKYQVRPEQFDIVFDFVERWDDHQAVMGPPSFAARLARFFREGSRTFGCHVPRFVVSSFSDGVLTPCPNIWFTDMGNVLDEEGPALASVGATRFYELLLHPRPRIDACKGCYTPWDTLSMFVDGELSFEDLTCEPPYNGPRARSRIAEIYEASPKVSRLTIETGSRA